MATITDILLIVQTSSKDNSGTDNALDLEIDYTPAAGGQADFVLDTSNSNSGTGWKKNLDKSKATQFWWSLSSTASADNPMTTDNITEIELSIEGKDMWRPSSIYLFGLTDDDSNPMVNLASYPFWDTSLKFSEDSGEGSTSYQLYPYQASNEGGSGQYD